MSKIETRRVRPPVRLVQLSEQETHNDEIAGRRLLRIGLGKRGPEKRYVFIGILVLLLLASSLSSVVGYLMYNARYQTDISLAQKGVLHLQKAESLLGTWSRQPLDAQTSGQAKREFAAALETFEALNNDVQSIPGLAGQVPVYGTRLSAAQHLVPLAITLAQAGVAGSDMLHTLATALHDPLTSQGPGITQSDLANITGDVKELSSVLVLAARQIKQLQPTDVQFDPRIAKLINTFHKDLPTIEGWLSGVEQLLPVAPVLLGVGTPANYLIEVLDSTELRPGGGFIGNYGVATLSGGRLAGAHITDVDLLDRPFEAAGHTIAIPAQYAWFNETLKVGAWSLRDSNLDADFPTAAQYGLSNYAREGGSIAMQGVIAITPTAMQQALTITGPIAVPEYQETVTAQNLVARIHYHQLAAQEGSDAIPSPDGHSSLRKRFTELLAEHFMTSVHHLPPSTLARFVPLVVNAVRSKDIQIYFKSDVAEALLQKSHLDAAIQAAPGDGLFVVDANVSANKANSFIMNTMSDQVNIDAQGNAVHRTTLTYAWTASGQNYGNPEYRDYVRVYVPVGSQLQTQEGWQAGDTTAEFGRKVLAGFFTLGYGQTHTIILTWTAHSAAKRDAVGWHYQYLMQRQAGILWSIKLNITLPPSCATQATTSDGQVSTNKQGVMLAQILKQDTSIGLNYGCQ